MLVYKYTSTGEKTRGKLLLEGVAKFVGALVQSFGVGPLEPPSIKKKRLLAARVCQAQKSIFLQGSRMRPVEKN